MYAREMTAVRRRQAAIPVRSKPAGGVVAEVLRMQRSAGNAAVANLIQRQPPAVPAVQEAGLDAAAIESAKKQIRRVATDQKGHLRAIIPQLRAFFQLSTTATVPLTPGKAQAGAIEWITDDLVRELADWQSGEGLPVDGKLTEDTLASLRRAGLGSKDWYRQLDERDQGQLGLVGPILGPGGLGQATGQLSARQAIVATAESQIGQVNALDRGDGNKYGWERLVDYYQVAGVYQAQYLPALKQANKFINDAQSGPWSWCGIFAIWATKKATGKGQWVDGKPGSDFDYFTRKEDPKLDGIEPGDIVAITGAANHHTIVKSKSPDGRVLTTVDGNQLFQGIYINQRALSSVTGYYKPRL